MTSAYKISSQIRKGKPPLGYAQSFKARLRTYAAWSGARQILQALEVFGLAYLLHAQFHPQSLTFFRYISSFLLLVQLITIQKLPRSGGIASNNVEEGLSFQRWLGLGSVVLLLSYSFSLTLLLFMHGSHALTQESPPVLRAVLGLSVLLIPLDCLVSFVFHGRSRYLGLGVKYDLRPYSMALQFLALVPLFANYPWIYVALTAISRCLVCFSIKETLGSQSLGRILQGSLTYRTIRQGLSDLFALLVLLKDRIGFVLMAEAVVYLVLAPIARLGPDAALLLFAFHKSVHFALGISLRIAKGQDASFATNAEATPSARYLLLLSQLKLQAFFGLGYLSVLIIFIFEGINRFRMNPFGETVYVSYLQVGLVLFASIVFGLSYGLLPLINDKLLRPQGVRSRFNCYFAICLAVIVIARLDQEFSQLQTFESLGMLGMFAVAAFFWLGLSAFLGHALINSSTAEITTREASFFRKWSRSRFQYQKLIKVTCFNPGATRLLISNLHTNQTRLLCRSLNIKLNFIQTSSKTLLLHLATNSASSPLPESLLVVLAPYSSATEVVETAMLESDSQSLATQLTLCELKNWPKRILARKEESRVPQ